MSSETKTMDIVIIVVCILCVLVWGALALINYLSNDASKIDTEVFYEEIKDFVSYCNDTCVGETSIEYIDETDTGHYARISVGGVVTVEDAYENIILMSNYIQNHANDAWVESYNSISVYMTNIGCPHDELLIIGFDIRLPDGVITAVDMQTNSIAYDIEEYDCFSQVVLVGVWSNVPLTDEEEHQLKTLYPNAEIVIH